MRLVVFGVSNVLGHILDCALDLELTPSLIVMNTPEVKRPRARSIHDRIKLLREPPRIIEMQEFSPEEGECYFVGTTALDRRQLVEDIRLRFGLRCRNLVHPSACVSPHSMLASGIFIGAHSIIGPGAEIGEHVYVGAKVLVGHEASVEPYARLLADCNVAGHTRVGFGATIGMGATVIEELEIGPEASIAAGAVVIGDVPARVLVAGVPAEFKKNL